MKARLTVNAKLDKSRFPINVEATAEEMVSVNLGSPALYRGMGLCHQAEPVYRLCRQVDSLGLVRRTFPAKLLTLDWLTLLNQPVSLPVSSQH